MTLVEIFGAGYAAAIACVALLGFASKGRG